MGQVTKKIQQNAQWVRKIFTHTELQAAALKNDIEIMSLPGGCKLRELVIVPLVAFAGCATYTLSVGIVGELDRYSTAFDVKQIADVKNSQCSILEDWNVATSVRLAAVATVNNLDLSSAGSAEVWLLIDKIK